MIDPLAPSRENAALRALTTRSANFHTTRGDGTATGKNADPDAPSGPRPTFAISTLEQIQAAQKVAPISESRPIDATVDGTQDPPALDDPTPFATVNLTL